MSDTAARRMERGDVCSPSSPFRGLALSISVRTDRTGRAFSPLEPCSGVVHGQTLNPRPAFPSSSVYSEPSTK